MSYVLGSRSEGQGRRVGHRVEFSTPKVGGTMRAIVVSHSAKSYSEVGPAGNLGAILGNTPHVN